MQPYNPKIHVKKCLHSRGFPSLEGSEELPQPPQQSIPVLPLIPLLRHVRQDCHVSPVRECLAVDTRLRIYRRIAQVEAEERILLYARCGNWQVHAPEVGIPKCRLTHGPESLREPDQLQRPASFEGAGPYAPERASHVYPAQRDASLESLLADKERAVGQLHCAQPFAFVERSLGYVPYRRRQRDALETVTFPERARAQALQVPWQADPFEAAKEERPLPDVFDALRCLEIGQTAAAEGLLPYALRRPSEPQGADVAGCKRPLGNVQNLRWNLDAGYLGIGERPFP